MRPASATFVIVKSPATGIVVDVAPSTTGMICRCARGGVLAGPGLLGDRHPRAVDGRTAVG
jgi:hypothetical protein